MLLIHLLVINTSGNNPPKPAESTDPNQGQHYTALALRQEEDGVVRRSLQHDAKVEHKDRRGEEHWQRASTSLRGTSRDQGGDCVCVRA